MTFDLIFVLSVLSKIVACKGRTIRNPGRGGGGENSPQKIRAKKNAWKKNSRSHYVREKKIVQANSKVENSLEKKFLQRLNA